MKQFVRIAAEVLSVTAFAISTLAEALRTDIEPVLLVAADVNGFMGQGAGPVTSNAIASSEAISIIQQPVNGALWSLLVVVVIAAAAYLMVRWSTRFAEPLPTALMLGLWAAAIWPWIVSTSPGAGLAIAGLAPLGVITGMLQDRDEDLRDRGEMPMAIIAGWLLIGGMTALSALLHLKLHVQIELAVLMGLLAAALIGGRVQLALGNNVGFSGAIIWAMLGIAAASLDASMTVATACVLGIAALVVVLVRVTT